ncbi:MAG: ABC transporter [Firmicutes bacterium]|nr:ABC transporter [Bacillota bacterium]
MKKIISLSYNDFRNVLREPMLIMLLIGPVAMTLAIRYLIPILTNLTSEYFDLTEYYPLIGGSVVLFIPMLIGMLIGFILLDERDDSIFLMLIVTPLGRKGYLIYRTLFPAILSIIFSVILLPLIGIVKVSFIEVIAISLLASLEAPVTALLLAGIANNKVEGLAISKGLGIFLIIPIIAYFIKSPWKIIGGVIPYYWPFNAIVAGNQGNDSFWLYIIGGFIVEILILIWLVNRYEKKAA